MYNNKYGKEYGYGDCTFVPPPPGGIPTDYETYVPAPPKLVRSSNMLRDTEAFLGMPSAPMKGPNETSERIMVPSAEDGGQARPQYAMDSTDVSDGEETPRSSLEIERCPSLDTEISSIDSTEDMQDSVVLSTSSAVLPKPEQKGSTEAWVLESPSSSRPFAPKLSL
jgi:hypothetical protein